MQWRHSLFCSVTPHATAERTVYYKRAVCWPLFNSYKHEKQLLRDVYALLRLSGNIALMGRANLAGRRYDGALVRNTFSVSSLRPMCSLYTGATVQDEERVLQRFLNDRTTSFHKNIRPVRNTLDPVNVTFDITFHSVIEMVCILCIWRCFSLSLHSACACVLPATPWNEILSVAFYKTIHYLWIQFLEYFQVCS